MILSVYNPGGKYIFRWLVFHVLLIFFPSNVSSLHVLAPNIILILYGPSQVARSFPSSLRALVMVDFLKTRSPSPMALFSHTGVVILCYSPVVGFEPHTCSFSFFFNEIQIFPQGFCIGVLCLLVEFYHSRRVQPHFYWN